MGYNGLAKELRKRWGKGKKADADDVEARPESNGKGRGAEVKQDWNENAQDQISALLSEVPDEADDDALDLAAIRQALADKEAAKAEEEPAPTGTDDLYLVIDEIVTPEPGEEHTPMDLLDPSSLQDKLDTASLTPTAAVMEPIFKDVVVSDLLSEGIITLPQALTAVRQHAKDPRMPLWRLLLEHDDVELISIFERAADLLGYEVVDVEERYTAEEIHAALDRLPDLLKNNLAFFNLLPFEFGEDPNSASKRWLLATHDPARPELGAVLKRVPVPVKLYYAPEHVVTYHLEKLLALPEEEEPRSDEDEEAPPDEPSPLIDLELMAPDDASLDDASLDDAVDDGEAVQEILEVEENGFLELHWEPLETEDEADDEAEAALEKKNASLELEWKTLAELADQEAAEMEASAEDVIAEATVAEAPITAEEAAESPVAEEETAEDLIAEAVEAEVVEEEVPVKDVLEEEAIEEDLLEEEVQDWLLAEDEPDDPVATEEITESVAVDPMVSFSFEFTEEELTRLEETDALPTDDVVLSEIIAPELLEDADEEAPRNGAASFDGMSIELPDQAPIPDISDWTQEREPGDALDFIVAPESTDELTDEPASEAPEAEPEPVTELELEAASEPDVEAEAGSEPVDKPETRVEPELVVETEPEEDVLSDLNELSAAELKKLRAKDRVVGMLLRKKAIEAREVRLAQKKQQDDELKEPLWRILTLLEGVDRDVIFAEAASVYAFKTAEMGGDKPDPEFARSVMNTFDDQLRDSLLKLRVVPFEVDLDPQTGAIKVVFITHDPARPDVHRVMQKLKLERFELRYAPEKIVTGLIIEAFPRKNEYLERLDENSAFDIGTSYEESNELIDEEALEAEISRSKLINLFEATLVEAVRQDASDVHIWPNAKKQIEIHFRIDGRLRRWHVEDKVHPEAFIAVIKDNSMNVDRFERDAAQDGFIQRWIDEALIRFRVSVLPIANVAQDIRSESIVIRVLDDRKVVKDLAKLGLNTLALERFRKAITQPHGMVILTGPTGSGKTTTLYASLHEVINPEVNVLTVEDPVEYILPGVRQIKLNNKLGLDGALRSILRHDPDVVMVGEMRDKPTAELAIKLANTGHLTFSTLHTNDAASAVTRLYKMGIEPFLIAYAINLVVAQRLIRRLCPTCKKEDPDPDHVLMKKLGFSAKEIKTLPMYVPGTDDQCPMCKGMGFKGRRAVSEAMYFSREIRHLIADSEGGLDEITIKDLAMEQGMMTLADSAREVVKEGDTSILEMMRVVSADE